MPIIKSAQKAARQTAKRTEHNKQIKKDIKAAVKAFKATPTGKSLAKAQSEFDKAVKKGLLKKNTASRRKSALAKIMKAFEQPKPAKKTVAKKPAEKKATTTKKTTTAKKPAAKKTSPKAKAEKKAE